MLIGAVSVFFVNEADKQEITSVPSSKNIQENNHAIVGTTTPFASEAVYFVVTDRFVDGDPSNNHEEQGGDHPTWQLP